MPSLLVGTVGGGTILPTQKSALSIMGIDKKVSSIEFAKLIGGVVLAGELSLLSALASGALGKSHKELGRKKI
jgi:hydroxymethylglutaryl-CoA reductase (NADPH)